MCGCHTVDVENTLLGGNTLLTNPDVRRGTHIHRPSTSVRMDSISAAGTAPAAAEVPDPPTYRQMYIPYRTGTSADAVRLPVHCRVAKWNVFGFLSLVACHDRPYSKASLHTTVHSRSMALVIITHQPCRIACLGVGVPRLCACLGVGSVGS